MSDAKEVTFNLKVVINKEKTRVLFAEVENDFVNLLFSFLILPLGVIVQILDMHYGDKIPRVIGSLNTLYNGLANLGGCSFQKYVNKPKIFDTELRAYGFPHLNDAEFSAYDSHYYLGKAYFVVYEVFTTAKASFIICDDLRIAPNAKGSIVQTLKNVGLDLADIQKLATADLKKMILKAMFCKSSKKFLLAQAGEDFVSFIFTMLKIPLGMVDLHLGGNSSFNNLYHLHRSIGLLFDQNCNVERELIYKTSTIFKNY